MPTRVDFLGTSAPVKLTRDGATAMAQFMVYDLGGNKESRVGRAILLEGVPRPGDAHPGLAGLFAEEVNGDYAPGDIDAVIITVNYKTPDKNKGGANDKWTIETGAVVQTTQTNYLAERDSTGKRKPFPPIKYTWQEKDGPDSRGNKRAGKEAVPATGLVEIYVPVVTWRMTRKESKSPRVNSLAYTSKINSAPWNDGAPGTWMCSRIAGTSQDQGKSYDVTYEFMFNPNTWQPDVVYIDTETGKPPPGIGTLDGKESDNGILRQQKVYEAIDFGPLNLEGEPPQAGIGFVSV